MQQIVAKNRVSEIDGLSKVGTQIITIIDLRILLWMLYFLKRRHSVPSALST